MGRSANSRRVQEEAAQQAGNVAPEELPASPAAAASDLEIDPTGLTAEEQRQLLRQQAMVEMDRLAKEAEAAAAEHLDRGEILIEKVIDPHEGRLATVLSYWTPLTPSLCTERKCGYDAAVAVGFTEGWDVIPEDMPFDQNQTMREFVESILARHQSIKHPSAAPKHIRTAAEARAIRAKVSHPLPGQFITNPHI